MHRLLRTMIIGLGSVCLASFGTATSQTAKVTYGYCMGLHGPKEGYLSPIFEIPSPPPNGPSITSQFIDFVKNKYGVSVNRWDCQSRATREELQAYRTKVVGKEDLYVATGWKPDFSPVRTAASSKPQPPPAPAPTASPLPAPAPSQPRTSPAPATTFVICRSEFNTDLRRFYNPPVDGRGAGYTEWSASYQGYLDKTYKFKATNLSCGKYPDKAAAQADYDAWVGSARASPTVNGLPSPIIITDWKY